MQLGFFITNQYLPGESMPRKIAESAAQVQAARAAGFDLICTGQHYLAAPYQMSASFPPAGPPGRRRRRYGRRRHRVPGAAAQPGGTG